MMTFEQIGAEVGLSAEMARRTFNMAMAKLEAICEYFEISPEDVLARGFSMISGAEKWADE